MSMFNKVLSGAVTAFGALTLLATEVYVDPNIGSDTDHGGNSPADAYKSLTKAMAERQPGDIVHAGEGTYELESATALDGYASRVVVPAGVTLVATGRVEKTIIEGEAGMRCVWLTGGSTAEQGAKLKGFTVRGGYITDTTDQKHYGAGVATDAGTALRHRAIVEDCLITANTNGCRGAGLSSVIARRCRIVGNKSTAHGSAAYYGMLYNCIVDDNESGNATCFNTPTAVNCTFGPGNNQRGFQKSSLACTNCIFLGKMIDDKGDGTFKFDHCVFASDATGMEVTEEHIGTGSYLVPAEQIQLTDDYTPIRGSCVAVDAGDNDAVDGETDVYGDARIYNETVDMGAVEAGAMLTIAASDGGIAVTGAQIGLNKLTDTPITVTVTRTFDSHYGCCGIRYDGELIRFGEGEVGESWTHAFSAVEGAPSIVAVYEKVWYVDANVVQEPGQTYDGRSKGRAYKTLASAMGNEDLASGDEVRALAGTYDDGTMTAAFDSVLARVVVPAGVVLASAEGADKTVIKGGTDIRGVWLEEGATVRGFTIRDANMSVVEGGGVAMRYDQAQYRNLAFVEDCCITNNTATRGGGCHSVIVRRSRILNNTGTAHAAAIYCGALYDCVVDGHQTANACTHTTTPIVNCTFGAGNAQRALTKMTNIYVTNTLFMSEFQPSFVTPGYVTVDHCLFATNNASGKITTASAATLTGTGSTLIDYRDAKLKGDYSLRRTSVAIDAGTTDAASEKDVFGNARVCGEAVDVGAAEFDPTRMRGMMLLLW